MKSMRRKMTRILYCLLATVMAVAQIVPAHAQEPGRQQILREQANLEKLLAEATELLVAFPNTQANDLIQKAKQLRDQAATHLANGRILQARLDIRAAMQYVEQALKLALASPVQRLKLQLEDLMRRADYEVIGSGNRDAEQLLQQGKKAQASAELAMVNGSFRRAVDYFRLAIGFVNRALNAVKGNLSSAGPDEAESVRQQFENLAARARETLDAKPNAAAQAIYDQALKQARDAESALSNGRKVAARQLFAGAVRLLLRSIDLAGAGTMNPKNRLEGELSLLTDLIASTENQLEEQNDARGMMLVGRARLLVDDARRALARGNEPEAEWRLGLARSFVSKAMRGKIGDKEAFESRLEEELAQLHEDVNDLEHRAADQKNQDALEIAGLARLTASKADRAFANGRPRIALQALLATQRFLALAETLLGKAAGQELSRNEVSQKLDRLEVSLQDASESVNASGSEVAVDLVKQVMEIRDRAREALNRGRLRVASESIDVATEMLRTALKASASGHNR